MRNGDIFMGAFNAEQVMYVRCEEALRRLDADHRHGRLGGELVSMH
jgi:hypothetical protein